MKATIIFSTLFFFATLMGCADNLNVNDPMNMEGHSTSQSIQKQGSNNDDGSGELIWNLDELRIKTIAEGMVEGKAVYTLPPIVPPYMETGSYVITFEGYTNAGRFTNGYEAFADVTWENETNGTGPIAVFTGAGSDELNGHRRIRLSDVEFTNIKFHVALFQVDGPVAPNDQREPSNVTTLKLSDIRIYKSN